MYDIYTIGHSNHSTERFIELLKMHDIEALVDVRSNPFSNYAPQFNKEMIKRVLKSNNIAYVYLGNELGPRSDDPKCYLNGKVQYNILAKQDTFQQGPIRLKAGLKSYRIALMCSEKDPIKCHRTVLICRHLMSMDIEINHILEDGAIETNKNLERRLMRLLKIPEQTLFEKPEETIQRAYDIQSKKIAFTMNSEFESVD